MRRHTDIPRVTTWDQFKREVDEGLRQFGLRGDIEISAIDFSGYRPPSVQIVAGQLYVEDSP